MGSRLTNPYVFRPKGLQLGHLDPVVYHNNITNIVLTGFPFLKHIKIQFFLVLFLIYCVTMSGNLVIVVLYHLSKTLQSPMYLFITQLSLLDIILSTDIIPNLLYIILHDGCTMSLAGCIIQFSFFAQPEASECFLLTVMSYDRYLAICKPLHYNSIMNQSICIKSVIIIWVLGFTMTLVDFISLCSLYYCGPNIIHHFFCDFEPILELSCSDTSWLYNQAYVLGFIYVVAPFILIVISYIYIVSTILKIKSITGRKKAFTTCSSHLTVVCIFYGALIAVYLIPTKGQKDILNKILSLFYTVMTPLLNPIIYTFRNKDFKTAIEKIKFYDIPEENQKIQSIIDKSIQSAMQTAMHDSIAQSVVMALSQSKPQVTPEPLPITPSDIYWSAEDSTSHMI
ncbi:olfactory receptor 154-like [Rana temporaria]|uniref:olfactory receptor 154-like n=1 Tax=Rana temporaria TaxID=8407 RepID=UPI001AADA78C|nr:olfactory receptor 154-like [Rana temporaria]